MISSSQLGATEQAVANAIRLMSGPDVRHYWDGGRRVGTAMMRFVQGLEYPAWDLWMAFRPGVTWGDEPPEPDWWEHQLSSLGSAHDERRLDAERFVERALELADR